MAEKINYELDTLLLKQEVARIGYTNGFLFPHEKETRYIHSCGKRNSLYPIRATSFVSIVMYLTCTI